MFAEAVLGRFNSAEKIDLKRFWNWQDSPIPDAAPEIAAIRAASRAQAEGLMPGQLGAPVVSIQAPAALPAAAGVAPMLAAIQNSAFRDMSGVAQTAALAQAAAQGSGAAATAAGGQAARNLFNMMDQHTQRMKIASDLIGSLYGAGAATGDSGGGRPAAGRGTPTARGLQLRVAEQVDERKSAGAPATSAVAPAAAATGAAAGAAAAAPATLEEEVLRSQSGTNINQAAEQMIRGGRRRRNRWRRDRGKGCDTAPACDAECATAAKKLQTIHLLQAYKGRGVNEECVGYLGF